MFPPGTLDGSDTQDADQNTQMSKSVTFTFFCRLTTQRLSLFGTANSSEDISHTSSVRRPIPGAVLHLQVPKSDLSRGVFLHLAPTSPLAASVTV